MLGIHTPWDLRVEWDLRDGGFLKTPMTQATSTEGESLTSAISSSLLE